jgi:hypothetical protein
LLKIKFIKKIIINFNLSERSLIKNFPSYNSLHWKKFNKNKQIYGDNIKNFLNKSSTKIEEALASFLS